MTSTTIADYQVLADAPFDLNALVNAQKEKTLKFDMPPDFAFGTGSRKPILAFMMRIAEDSVFKVFLNGREIVSYDLSRSNTARGFWEAWDSTEAFPDGASFNDPVDLRWIIANGQVRISDVVMWYQIKR